MKKQIILTLGTDGEFAPFSETERFTLYQKEMARWHEAESFEQPVQIQTANTIRETVVALAARFPDCRIIVSRKVAGIAYQTLDKSGYSIFEADSMSDGLLNSILKDVLEIRAEPDLPPTEPQSPLGNGHYYFDLARLQKAYPEISSKRALMGFMTSADFLSLELVCDHLPPWMDDVMTSRGYGYSRKSRAEDAAVYTIVKK